MAAKHNWAEEIKPLLKKYKDKINKEELLKTIKEDILEEKKYYGFNYWKAIIKETLINDNNYLALMFS